jgi:hypothetical protein
LSTLHTSSPRKRGRHWVEADVRARAEGGRSCQNATMLAALRDNLGQCFSESTTLAGLTAIVEGHAAEAQGVIDRASDLCTRVKAAKARCAAAMEHLLRVFLDIERGFQDAQPSEHEHEGAAAGVLAATVAGHLYHTVGNLQLRAQPPIAGVQVRDRDGFVGIGAETSELSMDELAGPDGDTAEYVPVTL